MRFAEILKGLREDSDITQATIAKVLKLHRGTISGYETGKKEPSFDILCKIADYFHVSTDYLLGRTGRKNKREL